MDQFVASVPASAILIGEYTHYTSGSGHALATPLPLVATVNVRTVQREPGYAIICGASPNEVTYSGSLAGNHTGQWSALVLECLRLASADTALPAVRVEVKSQLPVSWGSAASASLCAAVLRAVNRIADAGWFDDEIARMAHRAECEFAGMARGKTDQYACAHGRAGQVTLLDTKSLRSRNYRLDYRLSLMVVDPGHDHDSAAGERHKTRLRRLAECTEARDRLGVASLGELGCRDLPRLSSLPAAVAKRAWHVITENMRALEFVRALEHRDLERQADLLAASHASQRDDFEFSTPEADALVQSSIRFGVQGAKLVGDGGPVIALVPQELVSDWWAHISEENPKCSLISTDLLSCQENRARWAVR